MVPPWDRCFFFLLDMTTSAPVQADSMSGCVTIGLQLFTTCCWASFKLLHGWNDSWFIPDCTEVWRWEIFPFVSIVKRYITSNGKETTKSLSKQDLSGTRIESLWLLPGKFPSSQLQSLWVGWAMDPWEEFCSKKEKGENKQSELPSLKRTRKV